MRYVVHCVTRETGNPYDILADASSGEAAADLATSHGHILSGSPPETAADSNLPPPPSDLAHLRTDLGRVLAVLRTIEASSIIRRPSDPILWALILSIVLGPLFWISGLVIVVIAAGGLKVIVERLGG